MDWFGAYWDWLAIELRFGFGWILLAIAAPIALFIFRYCVRLFQRTVSFVRSRQRTLGAVARSATKEGHCEGKGVWLTEPVDPPDNYELRLQKPPVLAIANLKGGVGKTTLTANLGAYFAKDYEMPLRVLLIDLDFQGSLSSMAFPKDNSWIPADGESSAATQLISCDLEPNEIRSKAKAVDIGTGPGSLSVLTAHYDLAQADNRILVEWLLRPQLRIPKNLREALRDLVATRLYRTQDVRYALAETLHSHSVQSAFDLIIIDCPPRLTTSEIQAFCASSHLLIPTIFDKPSAEAVASLCDQVETLKRKNKNGEAICPHLEYVGVVATKWRAGAKASPQAMQDVQDALQGRTPPLNVRILPEAAFVPLAAALVNDADEGIAYLVMPQRATEVRTAIGSLAEEIARSMRLPRGQRSYTPQPVPLRVVN